MKNIEEFLKESNAIERVYDEDSLNQAKIAWDYLMTQKVMTSGVVLKTHKILMLHQNIQPDERGYFRKCEVRIGFHFGLNYSLISGNISHWTMNVNDLVKNGKKEKKIFLERTIKEHHIEYEKIHPFIDGNGRTGRMFMNWERLQLKLPLFIIHEGKEQIEYYGWFK